MTPAARPVDCGALSFGGHPMKHGARKAESSWVKFAAFGDVHLPHVRLDAWQFAVSVVRDYAPALFVSMGDFLEGEAASKHPNDQDSDLRSEFRQAADMLAEIRNACPDDTRYVFLWGNHEDNLLRCGRLDKPIRSMADPNESKSLGPELAYWKQVPYIRSDRGMFTAGQVGFIHGYVSNEELQAIEFAGHRSNMLIVAGHSHRPIPPTQCKRSAKIPLPYYHANAGTLGPLQPDWAARMNTRAWAAAVILGTYNPTPDWSSKEPQWRAETIVM